MKGVLLAIGATVGWSLSGIFIRYIPEIDAWTFNAYRGASMGGALLLWMLLRYRGEMVAHFRQATFIPLVATAGFFGIGSSLYIVAVQKASVAAVSCVAATSPLFAALLAWVWLGEHSFVFLTLGAFSAWLGALDAFGYAPQVHGLVVAGWWVYFILYPWLAMKRVYGQGWFRTSLKYFILGITYVVLLAFGLVFAVILTLST